jgi:hypothetical protein
MAHRASTFAICSFLALLNACSGYSVTLNERPVRTPVSKVDLEQVADLNLRNCIEQTLSDKRISDPAQLTTLVCTHAGVERLPGLEQFQNLQRIDLSNNELARVRELFDLPRLVYVNLEGNPGLFCAHVKTLTGLPREDLEVVQPAHCR